ncbi:class I SAM-dependent methyltransferase [Candidatus Roizmanbacteria bacterium]|nr:class I SAM-dependent methyltransferase [Candidatus Roizmanbacteria bacterium]
MFNKDDLLFFDHSPYSPHSTIYGLIKKDSTILDIGCNAGYLGRELQKKSVISDGVDSNKKALEKAKKYYRSVFFRDLYTPRLQLANYSYDYIVLADILEHLPQPGLLLTDCKKYLKKSGKVIISLPNVARIEIRLGLLLGKFNYSPGILGEDHLRFFTRDTGIKLIEDSGLRVEKIIPTGFGKRIGMLPTLFAFQFIFVCALREN